MKNLSRLIFFFIAFVCLYPANITAQVDTKVSGVVKDSITGEPLPFVSIAFEGSKIGIISDNKGGFQLHNKEGLDTLTFSFVGYKNKKIKVTLGKNQNLDVFLQPEDYQVSEIIVTPGKEYYSKKNNPAIELIEKVIENKDKNRIENNEYYQFEQYEKLSLSFTELSPEMRNQGFFNKMQFIFDYLDTSEISNNKILTFSIRETLSDEYRRKKPKSKKSIVRAIRHEGLDEKLNSERMDALWSEAIKQVNVFDNEIDLLFKRFISPLSSSRATSFYKYYIMDTIMYENQKCIDLAFIPFNNQDMGFTGNLWIAMDSLYSIRKVILKTPRDINLNFIAQMSITQEFEQLPNDKWAKSQETSAIEFSLFKIYYGLYAKNVRSFKNYVINQTSDLVFGFNDEVITIRNSDNQTDSTWNKLRHIPLKLSEDRIQKLGNDFEKVPYYNLAMQVAQILTSNYAHTSKSMTTSKFDIGPIGSIFSHNDVQGYRFRLGGRTTAHLNNQLFFKGYGAYGTKDHKFMYSASGIYSLYKKKYHENEYRKNNFGILYQYDIHIPGQNYYYNTSPDNFFLSFKRGKADKMTYVKKAELWYEKEFSSGFYWNFWSKIKQEQATGSLKFEIEDSFGKMIDVGKYKAGEVGFMFRYARNEKFHQGRDSRLILKRDGPIFAVSQSFGLKGYLGGEYKYNFTELYAQKRFWLSGYGHLNVIGKAGQLWGTVPYPLLILPNANQTYTIQPEAYSMMNTLEFINDRYASVDVTYELDGWLFNRIPYIRQFKLREVLSFKGLIGDLSDKNNPEHNKNLFIFPENSYQMTTTPYMEVSFGIENIFKLFRVDYVRRLTYLHHEGIAKNGIRVNVNFSF